MFETIHENVNKCIAFTKAELDVLDELLEQKFFAKKTYLLKANEVCSFEAYVNKGCVRIFFINENGSEVTLAFGIEDWWVSDISSFNEQIPSKLFIETLEDCELLVLNKKTKEELLQRVPKFERVFRLMVQKNLSSTQNRLINTISKSATEKYEDFLVKYPSLSQRVPQHYIASYLGISAEFLSKVRAKMVKK